MDDVNFISHISEVYKEFDKKVKKGMKSIGEEARGFAIDDVPVDTSRLQNSIDYKVTLSNEAHIGTNVEYAVYVEFNDDVNHPRGGKAHFLRDAVSKHGKLYEAIMKTALKS